MLKKILLGLVIIIAIVYFYPSQKFTFEQLYTQKDSVLTSLQNFRKEATNTLKVGEYDWTYYTAGNSDTTILFLHGMGGSYDIWWQQLNYFKARYKVISLSYPPITNLKDLSAGVIDILNNEKISKVIVIGSSLGGYLAQYIAATYPERISKAMLGNTFAPNTENKQKNEPLVKAIKWLPEWFFIKNLRKKYDKEVTPASGNSPILFAFSNELIGKQLTRKVFIARYYCVVDTFTTTISPNIPLQIVESDNDPLVSKNLRDQIKSTYPHAKVITLHNEGHFPYLFKAESYNKIIEDFVKR